MSQKRLKAVLVDLLMAAGGRESGPLVVCVDGGLAGTGIAVWRMEDWDDMKCAPAFHASFALDGLDEYAKFYAMLAEAADVALFFVEDANYHGTGSAKGQAAAESGSLVKLAKYIGCALGVMMSKGVESTAVPVNDWKGQLPKEVAKERILRLWPECDCTNHDWDAVGIGLHCMGYGRLRALKEK